MWSYLSCIGPYDSPQSVSLTAINSSCVHMTWKSPDSPNGPITSYQVGSSQFPIILSYFTWMLFLHSRQSLHRNTCSVLIKLESSPFRGEPPHPPFATDPEAVDVDGPNMNNVTITRIYWLVMESLYNSSIITLNLQRAPSSCNLVGVFPSRSLIILSE